MARRKKRRGLFSSFSSVKHPKFFKYLTIFGATVGILSSTVFSVLMGVDAVKGDLITDDVREYTASFSSEGAVISKATYKRGELLEVPENPTHEIDGENNYFFIGWDTNKNGIPDIVPTRAYYSFDAEAVYFRTGKFDMNFLDLLNMDLEDLLQLLQNLNIDWEQFMSMFNIDPETLMQWLQSQMVLTFTTDPAPSSYPTYFRSTSYGDFDYGKKSFKNPDYYDSDLISDGSINPLSYTAYKLKKLDEANLLPTGFGFTNYNITFNAVEDYYPVPDCESSNDLEEIIDSDAHYLTKPKDNKYTTSAVYCPAFGYVIDLFSAIPLTGTVARDEKNYYRYALEHYTSIPNEYTSVIDSMIDENGWYEEELYQVDSIAGYVSSLGQCSLFNDDGSVDVNSYLNSQKKSKDPVMDLINNKKGSDLDFNTTAVMLFRRLNIPARLVKGYVSVGSQRGENSISLFNQHYWCEIYIRGTGWMICDCMDLSAITGTNPYKDMDQSNTPLDNKHVLESIKVTAPIKTEYYIGEDLDLTGGSLLATFTDGTKTNVRLTASGVEITGFDSSTAGPLNITVSYTYEGVTKTDKFQVTIKEHDAELLSVEFDFTYVKKEYYVGDPFDSSGIIATGQFDDGHPEDLSNRVNVGGDYNTNEPGTYTVVVYVTVRGVTKQDTYKITVYANSPQSLVIDTPPNKLEYFEGDDLILDGLQITISYKSGDDAVMTFDGVAAAKIGRIEFSKVHFTTAEEHQIIEVKIYNEETKQYVSDTFEVRVKENKIESYQAVGFKTNYHVGEYFDTDAFKANGYIVATMSNEKKIKIYEDGFADSSFDFNHKTTFNVTSIPQLNVVKSTNAVVSFTYNDNDFDVPVPINVTNIDTRAFVFNNDTSGTTTGAGSYISEEQLFRFQTSYVGTMFFRNASYDTYSPKGWTDSSLNSNGTPTSLGYSPNSFVYDKAKQVYQTADVTIDYLSDVPHSVIPVYTNSKGYDSFETTNTMIAGDSVTYNFTNFATDYSNIERFTSSYFPYSGSLGTYENSYRSQLNKYTSMSGISSDVSSYINTYVSGHSYTSNNSNIYNRINVVNRVKQDLYNDFIFNPKFVYNDSARDPLASFFVEGVGSSKSFATAATMIFRKLNIPARYVTGFGAYSTGSSSTTVTTKDVHAWCEVYFNGIGWLVVDPTNLDSGEMRGTTGSYGGGFGGYGIYSFSKISYSGVVSISYDYSSFDIDPDADPTDPARYYVNYDGEDHSKVYTITCEVPEGQDPLPDYLEYQVHFSWIRNGYGVGETYHNQPNSSNVPTVSYGQYRLVPYLEIYDKSSGEYVTYDYNYRLADDTQSLQYYVRPLFVCVYIYGNDDVYYMDDKDSITLNAGKNSDIYFTTEMPEGIIAYDFCGELPSDVDLDITGYFVYTGEGGENIEIDYENIKIIVVYNGQYGDWDEFNVFPICIYGEVNINPGKAPENP